MANSLGFTDFSDLYRWQAIIEGDTKLFEVAVSTADNISFLKKAVREERKNGLLRDVDATDLVLWKLTESVSTKSATLADRISKLGELPQFAVELQEPGDSVLDEFPEQPIPKFLHIIVQIAVDQHVSKRARLDNSRSLHTPLSNRTYIGPTALAPDSPPWQSEAEMRTSIACAFKPFKKYISHLAIGKLDEYLDSLHHGDKSAPGLTMSTDPNLFLHDLGKDTNQSEQVRRLFLSGTTQVFETSGAGKTRLLLEGLCHHWGFYISCTTKDQGPVSGSRDFEAAVRMLRSMSSWDKNDNDGSIRKNRDATKRVIAMIFYTRAFILNEFVRCLPIETDVRMARRRWVLLQVMPPCLSDRGFDSVDDIFVTLFRSLCRADTDVMLPLIEHTLYDLTTDLPNFFPLPEGFITPYFAIIDEAREGADNLNKFFRSNTGIDLRPIHRELHRCLHSASWIEGIILSGAGLSTNIVTESSSSIAFQDTGRPRARFRNFTDSGL